MYKTLPKFATREFYFFHREGTHTQHTFTQVSTSGAAGNCRRKMRRRTFLTDWYKNNNHNNFKRAHFFNDTIAEIFTYVYDAFKMCACVLVVGARGAKTLNE